MKTRLFELFRKGVHTTVQNLDHHPGDGFKASGSLLRHGRAWVTQNAGPTLGTVEWVLLPKTLHAGFCVDDDEVRLGISSPLAGFYFTLLALKTLRGVDRDIRVAAHHGGLWWSLWNPIGARNVPRWRDGHLDVLKLFLGEQNYESILLRESEISVPLERTYSGRVYITRDKWWRPRWPFRCPRALFSERTRFSVHMDDGDEIPLPGKGENAYDCADDALFDFSGNGDEVDAVAAVILFVLRQRRKHGAAAETRGETER